MPEISPYFYDNPDFMPNLHAWGKDRDKRIPDPRQLGRDDSDLMTILDAMLGPGGYMKYLSALNKQRESAQAVTPTPSPTITPTPTPQSDIDVGIGAINKRLGR
jgi:hypothetical protein